MSTHTDRSAVEEIEKVKSSEDAHCNSATGPGERGGDDLIKLYLLLMNLDFLLDYLLLVSCRAQCVPDVDDDF